MLLSATYTGHVLRWMQHCYCGLKPCQIRLRDCRLVSSLAPFLSGFDRRACASYLRRGNSFYVKLSQMEIIRKLILNWLRIIKYSNIQLVCVLLRWTT